VDSELLISFIEERPILWDRTYETYKEKDITLEAWREICTIVNPDYESLDEREGKTGRPFFVINFTFHKNSNIINKYHHTVNSQTMKSHTLVLMPY
jgi:hypothetical protein